MNKGTIIFNNEPRIIATSSIGGPKESAGPLRAYINEKLTDDKYGEKTYEKAECKMIEYAMKHAMLNGDLIDTEIDAILAGDLLNQLISSSFSARDFKSSYIGLYSACSTMTEALAIGAMLVDGKYMKNVLCATGSHFSSAERQYRFPLELGNQRPASSQWTVTGAGGSIISTTGEYPRITSATFGRVIDYGIADVNNMGAAMAPAAMDTLFRHFQATKTRPEDYDLILTGDLGVLGSDILEELMWEKGYEIYDKHADCGELIYNMDTDEFQGGSGAGCSALVFNSYIYKLLMDKELNKIIFVATGALLSTISSQQGETIPGIAHAVVIES